MKCPECHIALPPTAAGAVALALMKAHMPVCPGPKKTPEEWSAEDGVTVADPDGWRFEHLFGDVGTACRARKPQEWSVPITRQEWEDRMSVSSVIRASRPDSLPIPDQEEPLEQVRQQINRYFVGLYGENYTYRAPETFPNQLEVWMLLVCSGDITAADEQMENLEGMIEKGKGR